jgi:16S rRNA (guanine(966)-N(2))-methyltransferase RsmD
MPNCPKASDARLPDLVSGQRFTHKKPALRWLLCHVRQPHACVAKAEWPQAGLYTWSMRSSKVSASARQSARASAALSGKPQGHAAHEVRIIGGQWRRTRLKVIDKPGLRPTPDRVRETLFNWLGQDLAGWRCVDAFAGTGALGLEAASRGAASVLMLEQDPALVSALQAHVVRLQAGMVQVQRTDAIAALQRLPAGSVDLVFIDPPFDGPWFESAL